MAKSYYVKKDPKDYKPKHGAHIPRKDTDRGVGNIKLGDRRGYLVGSDLPYHELIHGMHFDSIYVKRTLGVATYTLVREDLIADKNVLVCCATSFKIFFENGIRYYDETRDGTPCSFWWPTNPYFFHPSNPEGNPAWGGELNDVTGSILELRQWCDMEPIHVEPAERDIFTIGNYRIN